jgi:hypothetical protein
LKLLIRRYATTMTVGGAIPRVETRGYHRLSLRDSTIPNETPT